MGPIGHFSVGLAAQTCGSQSAARRPVPSHMDSRCSRHCFWLRRHREGRQCRASLVSRPLHVGHLVAGRRFVGCTHLSRSSCRSGRWAFGVQPLGARLRFPSHPVFQLFLALVALELWTSTTVRSSTSLRRLTESQTRLVQLHQCGRSHGVGVWNVHSGGCSLRDVRFQEGKNWKITPCMNRR
jgi:hypothetical protein